MKVFLLQHEYDLDGVDEAKLIGVYSSLRAAEQAQARAGERPGFREHPDGFSIDEYEVGRDGWTAGFATLGSDDAASGRSDQAA